MGLYGNNNNGVFYDFGGVFKVGFGCCLDFVNFGDCSCRLCE